MTCCGNADTDGEILSNTICSLDGKSCDYIEEFGCRHDKKGEKVKRNG